MVVACSASSAYMVPFDDLRRGIAKKRHLQPDTVGLPEFSCQDIVRYESPQTLPEPEAAAGNPDVHQPGIFNALLRTQRFIRNTFMLLLYTMGKGWLSTAARILSLCDDSEIPPYLFAPFGAFFAEPSVPALATVLALIVAASILWKLRREIRARLEESTYPKHLYKFPDTPGFKLWVVGCFGILAYKGTLSILQLGISLAYSGLAREFTP